MKYPKKHQIHCNTFIIMHICRWFPITKLNESFQHICDPKFSLVVANTFYFIYTIPFNIYSLLEYPISILIVKSHIKRILWQWILVVVFKERLTNAIAVASVFVVVFFDLFSFFLFAFFFLCKDVKHAHWDVFWDIFLHYGPHLLQMHITNNGISTIWF